MKSPQYYWKKAAEARELGRWVLADELAAKARKAFNAKARKIDKAIKAAQ